MELNQDQIRRELCELSYAVGQLVAQGGDFGLVTANIAIGYRDSRLATGEDDAPGPAYTGSRHTGPVPAVAAEPNSPAAQEQRRRENVDHWQAILSALNALDRATVEEVDCAAREARRDGLMWREIGEPLDLQKQGAYARFGKSVTICDDTPRTV